SIILALYVALAAIDCFRNFQFTNVSFYLVPVKMSVTLIQAGTQHNVVPDTCMFVVDVRTTDMYTNREVLDVIKDNVQVEVVPRSVRLNPSRIDLNHPVVQSGLSLGASTYGSPTMSDQALLPIPSLKVGPGDSARSHSADEFIYLREFVEGVEFYISLLGKVIK